MSILNTKTADFRLQVWITKSSIRNAIIRRVLVLFKIKMCVSLLLISSIVGNSVRLASSKSRMYKMINMSL